MMTPNKFVDKYGWIILFSILMPLNVYSAVVHANLINVIGACLCGMCLLNEIEK